MPDTPPPQLPDLLRAARRHRRESPAETAPAPGGATLARLEQAARDAAHAAASAPWWLPLSPLVRPACIAAWLIFGGVALGLHQRPRSDAASRDATASALAGMMEPDAPSLPAGSPFEF